MRFDTVLVMDWSAARAKSARPQKDAIWAGIARDGECEAPVYLRSRVLAEAWLHDFFADEHAAGRRVLAGFDFPFGYPAGFAHAVTGQGDPLGLWDWVEARISDDASGNNNRFEIASQINALFAEPGPFWGKHARDQFPGVPYAKKNVVFDGFAEKRRTDDVARSASSCFQLAFPPTVGGQVLMGLPILARLRRRPDIAVWPFEDCASAGVVLAEIWPSLIDRAVQRSGDDIRDRAQVRLLARALSLLPASEMADWMDVPAIALQEGWILGGGHVDRLDVLARETMLKPPRLKDDCFALPPGVDWTPVEDALARLRANVLPVARVETCAAGDGLGRILAADAIAVRANPPAANSAVDGYGFAQASTGAGDQVLPLVDGRAAAGAAFAGAVPAGAAIRILTGAILPEGVDTVVLEEDTTTNGAQVAFEGPIKAGANARKAGEDIGAGAVAVPRGTRLGPAELALLAATGVREVSLYRPLRVGVLSTGDEIVTPGSTMDAARTYDANRPMLLGLLTDWRFEAVDLGHVADDRTALVARLDSAAGEVDAILTSGGASAGDEDHVAAALGAAGTRHDWRIALKPGRPLALGMWGGVPIFALPGNPVAAMVCTMIFARPALGLMGGEDWHQPRGFMVPAGFEKNKKPGRREYLRARINADGDAEVFASEGSGRISGLAWADGLVEIEDGARTVQRGDLVRYIPYASFR